MCHPRGGRRQAGQGLVEYTVLLVFVVLVIVANPNIILELVQAVRDAYIAFVDVIAMSWIEVPLP
ncbi:hypothetical protein [Novilysobacter spongiicola]|uniref:Uncharacterized protein n=1 Tax=Lysobacter spongiicola DSM 21749 TaxID=1122188 RepID=A0A1T4PZ31_9GAMM|nr:hypothetical protein [Lysobacter spongiicola]MDX1548934.1 hypothetical protein [Lysobacter spongiicola]SJZ96699.1 hypothetical protein SAMN02745674_01397 [Lysobacter spongiicola DSM 21749]